MNKEIQDFCKRILPAVTVGASGDGEVYVDVDGNQVPLEICAFYSDMTYCTSSEPKHDSGKIIAGTVLGDFALALKEVCKVGTFDAEKYDVGSWSKISNAFARYEDDDMRHYLERCAGDEFDSELNLPHLAHEAWNALAKLELYMREKKQHE